jgi:MFS family permease
MLVPLGYFFSWNWWMLTPAHIIAGVTNAGIEMAYFNSVLRFSDEGKASHYQALFACILGIRGSIAPFIGAALKEAFTGRGWDFRYIFLLATVILFIGALMQVAGMRRERAVQNV